MLQIIFQGTQYSVVCSGICFKSNPDNTGNKPPPSNPNPLPHARNHTLFFFLSGDIYLFLPCLLPAHSSQSLSPDISSHSLSSFTPRLLSNFPALGPIHLPLCVPASLDHDIAHSLPLSTSILSSPHTTSILSPLLSTPLFIHSFIHTESRANIGNKQQEMQICARRGASLHFTLQCDPYSQHM